MRALEVNKITKKYANTTIFENLDFNVEQGQIVTILGKSGGGKSTLLRCICGLEKIDSGNIKIMGKQAVNEGKNTNESDEVFQQIGMVFQDYNLFTNMTVKNNITIAAKNKKIADSKEINYKADELIKTLDIAGNENKYPSQISGGQRQRVAIARALMLNPQIILFDEPTSALDIENSMKFVEIVNDLADKKYTVIIVTHDSSLVENLVSNKTYIMDKGILDKK